MTKESLAAKPVRMIIVEKQLWLRFDFDLAEDHLNVYFQGEDVSKIEAQENEEIHFSKIVKNENEKILQQLFYAIQFN